MLHHLGQRDRERTGSIETDRVELHRLALELERWLRLRAQKISESGRLTRGEAGRLRRR